MKSTFAIVFSVLGLAYAHPTRRDDNPIRILPPNWGFEITSLRGPGCPDFGVPDGKDRHTRLTYGMNTVDGSEIYYSFIAYPALRVELGGGGGVESTWCETELQYTEYKDGAGRVEGEDYRLRLHKNGSIAVSTYDIDSGVTATFRFTYLDADVTDSNTIRGPAASGEITHDVYLAGPTSGSPHEVTECGATKLRFRTELKIEAKGEGRKKGVVDSYHSTDDQGKVQYYGTQMGFSYDWQKCKK
ncbi:hypothetical protein F4802DRAFT_551190 [Xylaria palmicola]|nr:hypothetical protein F4802DRAFT_551190 [Xylaria palmicola]